MTGNTLLEVKVKDNIAKYLQLKALGYHTRWVGEGVICMGKIVKTADVNAEMAKIDQPTNQKRIYDKS